MKNLFIPYPLAVIAKEKGFDEDCIARWETFKSGWNGYKAWGGVSEIDEIGDEKLLLTQNELENHYKNVIKAPLYQQMIDWFREKHEMIFLTVPSGRNPIKFGFIVPACYTPNGKGIVARGIPPCEYYEALNRAIEEAFKLI